MSRLRHDAYDLEQERPRSIRNVGSVLYQAQHLLCHGHGRSEARRKVRTLRCEQTPLIIAKVLHD